MLIDLNPIKEPKPINVALDDYVVAVLHRDLYEANKLVTADYEDDREGYMTQVKILFEKVINSSSFQKKNKEGKLEKCDKPNVDLKLNDWQTEILWGFVAEYINDLFKKK